VGAYELDPDRTVILSQPADTNVIIGSNAMFSVTVGGTPPFAYQWFFNVTNVLAGETNATISITNAQPADAGTYQVAVSNVLNSVNSRAARLNVNQPSNSPPGISQEPPARQDVFVGTNVTISVTVTSATPVFYQWYFTDQATLTTAPLVGAVTNFVMITNVQITNSGLYQLIATNAFGSVASDLSKLVVTTNSPTTDTNAPPTPGIRGTPAKLKSSLKASKHKRVSMNGGAVWDAEPNRRGRRQFVAFGNSFPERRRGLSFSEPVAGVFNRRSIYS
jgi:hypothetical protein